MELEIPLSLKNKTMENNVIPVSLHLNREAQADIQQMDEFTNVCYWMVSHSKAMKAFKTP